MPTSISEGASPVSKACKLTGNVLSLVIMASFTVFVFYISFQHFTVYSLHPPFFTLGSLLLMSEAIFVISEDNFLAFFGLNHNQRVRLHWILQVGAAVSLTIGYISILLYKHKYNQSHLDTWHSVTGFISLILFVISVLWGVGIMYSSVTGIKNWIKPAKIKLIHIVFGVLTFVMGIVSEGFGIYLPWFLYYSNKEAQLVCTLLITLASILSIQSALVSVYKRTKRILQNADCRLF